MEMTERPNTLGLRVVSLNPYSRCEIKEGKKKKFKGPKD